MVFIAAVFSLIELTLNFSISLTFQSMRGELDPFLT